jgi:LCP family protein required for cell wall assembly
VTEPGHTRKATPFGPVLRGGRPRNGRPDWRLLGLMVASIVTALSLGLGVVATGLVWTGHRSILRTDVWGLETTQDRDGDGVIGAGEVQEVDEVLNILLVGSDSREGLTPEQLQALGTEEESGDRTDTIILAHLDPRERRVELLSFPRDLLVTRCDGSRGRINEAYQIGEEQHIGGPTCLVQTIHRLTRIPIDHFVQVNFAGFIDLVDAVGGVSFYLDQPVRDRYAGLDLPAGCVTLDGARSIGFVRARHIDNDFGRIARQQRFIREIVRKVTSVDILLNPQKLFTIISSVGKTVETDRGFGLAEMRQIAYTFRNLDVSSMTTWTVPSVESSRRAASYVEIQPEQAAPLFEAFRTGDFPPGGPVLQASSVPTAVQRDDAAPPSPPLPTPDAYRGAGDSIIHCGAA